MYAISNTSQLRSTRSGDRRGVVVGFVLVTLVVLSGCLALAVNFSRLRFVRAQLRSTCEAAALAGAAQLVDEGVLFGYPDPSDDILMAREYARLFGRWNLVEGREVVLDPNKSNAPQGDMVVGFLDPYEPVLTRTLQVATPGDSRPVNTLRVTARAGNNTYNTVTLWLGSLIGLTQSDVAASAQATVDSRVCGFRPEATTRAPIVPLAADYAAWCSQAMARAVSGSNDQYIVDPSTGLVSAGSDGVPEIRLTCGSSSASLSTDPTTTALASPDGTIDAPSRGACVPLVLVNDLGVSYVWPMRCREGLSRGDLKNHGGALLLGVGGALVPVETNLPPELPWGLMDSIGRCNAWPLGEPGADAGSWKLTSFGAGRIVAVRPVPNTQNAVWELIVQPSTLVCSQAVTRPDYLPNPWIAKLELTQ